MTVALSDREIRLLTALQSAGARGLTISAGRKRAGIARLIQAKYVARRATSERSGSLNCGGPLHGREGRFLLKYFLTERPKRRAYEAAVAQSSHKGRKKL